MAPATFLLFFNLTLISCLVHQILSFQKTGGGWMAFDFLNTLTTYLDFVWISILLLAPMLILGLFLSGLIHVFISRELVLKWLKTESVKSVSISAAIGVPIPLCSCSVVPVVAEMRKKGASRSSCMSFLITAPETGADSILVTNAFFGVIVAILRPLISFISAVVAGILSIILIKQEPNIKNNEKPSCISDQCCENGNEGHEFLWPEARDCYVSPSTIKSMTNNWFRHSLFEKLKSIFRSKNRLAGINPPQENLLMLSQEYRNQQQTPTLNLKKILKHIFHYGFVEIADDILFAMLVGIGLGGILYIIIPGDIMTSEFARWLSYPVMILVGIPLYICASASTPIAAALVAKGFSPGAALIFLMTGPATNTSTIAIIVSQFGGRFASVYVSSVIIVTAILGIITDIALLSTGYTLSVNLLPTESTTVEALQWGGMFLMFALCIWRYQAGAMRKSYQDMISNVKPLCSTFKKGWAYITQKW